MQLQLLGSTVTSLCKNAQRHSQCKDNATGKQSLQSGCIGTSALGHFAARTNSFGKQSSCYKDKSLYQGKAPSLPHSLSSHIACGILSLSFANCQDCLGIHRVAEPFWLAAAQRLCLLLDCKLSPKYDQATVCSAMTMLKC